MGSIRIGLVGLVALSAGCAASHASPDAPAPKQEAAADAPASATTQIAINNQNFSDMDVYLINGGARVLLGSAPGLKQTTLSLPRASVAGREVRLLADPIGGARSIRSPALVVAPGESIYWTIGADAASSSASAG